ncbi:MAG TPA: DUF3300 domain-containing protein [Terriglobales bacterium]|nr:DUF3300 domain-containing protein [Terriglobales bacterium]
MQFQVSGSGILPRMLRKLVAFVCAALLTPGDLSLVTPALSFAQDQQDQEAAAKIPAEQLDSLVAPVALYPDPLLSQVLVASTYPLEIVQLQQWLEKNKTLKDQALADAVKKQDWDASIQALAPLPDVAKYLSENIKWTTDLGNAFLAQQSDVMDAVQRMRKKAQDKGNLKSTEQQKVETKVVESKQVIVVEPSSPEIVYVPSYNPTVVYGAPAYPYPPVAYPPPGYYAAGMAISFGVGMAMGAAFGGGWGWGCGWGGNNNIYVNNNNNFVRSSNANINRNTNISNRSGNTWQHNPRHRGGAPYSNRQTANRFGGTTRGDSLSNRQANARQNQGQRGNRQQGGVSDRANRPQQAGSRERIDSGGRQRGGVSDRSADGNRNSGGGRAGNGADRGGGGDRVGNRSVSGGGGGSRNSSAFGGGGSSGSSARSSSARGSSSMGGGSRGSRGGGGGRRR